MTENVGAYAEITGRSAGTYHYTLMDGTDKYPPLKLQLNQGGLHNVENSVAAVLAARIMGCDDAKIAQAMSSFKGIKRRFEYVIQQENFVMIDDYAHHPREIEALINSLRDLFGDRKTTVVFQPHLYSRTRDFASDFAESLSKVEEVLLMDIYPAREEPIAGVSSEMIAGHLENVHEKIYNKTNLLEGLKKVKRAKTDVLVMVGAGSISELINPVKELFMDELN